MSVSPNKETTDMLIAAYTAARTKFIALGKLTDVAPYKHIEVRQTTPLEWAVHHHMLEEHVRELANELNEFGHQCRQLFSWAHILPEYKATDQLKIIREFIAATATSCVSYPHVLKARFVFSVSHLSHQKMLITDPKWKEKDLPSDRYINPKTMKKFLIESKEHSDFKSKFDELCDASYTSLTGNFRDKHHHRFPPRFELGITQTVTREREVKIQYGFGGVEPLKLIELAPLVIDQHKKALLCFKAYSSLLSSQLDEIYASDYMAL